MNTSNSYRIKHWTHQMSLYFILKTTKCLKSCSIIFITKPMFCFGRRYHHDTRCTTTHHTSWSYDAYIVFVSDVTIGWHDRVSYAWDIRAPTCTQAPPCTFDDDNNNNETIVTISWENYDFVSMWSFSRSKFKVNDFGKDFWNSQPHR